MSKETSKDKLKWALGELDFSNGPLVMGILNVTPDSFSDGGRFNELSRAVDCAVRMVDEGASIIDVGPESSRPGSVRVEPEEQIQRAVPVIRAIVERLPGVVISIDTYDADVARASIEAGASIINDITGLQDERMLEVAVEKMVPIVLMHMQGRPEDMQDRPVYDDTVSDILGWLNVQRQKAVNAGLPEEFLILDPGIGFGKSFEDNITILRELSRFKQGGSRLLLGTSRKGFLGKITSQEDATKRVVATAVTTGFGVECGVDIFRVHDVLENIEAIKVALAIKGVD